MSRIAFLGTPAAAVPTLRALDDGFEVALVITQPDRPRGRSGRPAPSPVKEEAQSLGLEVSQPANADGIRDALASAGGLDVAVVVAYGRILKLDALAVPENGMLNVHFSLLPRWRGAAPVPRALMAGDPMTGVTIIKLDDGLDTGPVLTAQAVDIHPGETAGVLTSRLATLGARLITEVIPFYLSGQMGPVPQTEQGMTYASKIEPDERRLQVDGSSEDAVNRVRALSPEPGATLVIDDDTHQVIRARLHDASPEVGVWVQIEGSPVVGFEDGGLELVEVRPPGKRSMSGEAWLRGRRRESGKVG